MDVAKVFYCRVITVYIIITVGKKIGIAAPELNVHHFSVSCNITEKFGSCDWRGKWGGDDTTVVMKQFLTFIRGSLLPIISSFQSTRAISSSSIKMGISNYASADGEFRRKDSSFRNHIQVGGKYPPERDRYHLYVSWACPWGNFPLHLN